MSLRNTPKTYGIIAKFFHWLVALLAISMLIFCYFLDDFSKGIQPLTYNIHKVTGVIILSIMLLRLIWTLFNTKPIALPNTAGWEKLAEKTVQFSLYAFLILMPLAGWMGASAAGKPPHLGKWEIALPIHGNKAFISMLFDLHGTIALILIALISMHFLAALYHQFIRKDDLLKRMI